MKTKILFISHSPFLNGAEICLYTLVKNINRNEFEPIVLFPFSGPMVDKIKKQNIKTYISPLERWIRFKFDKPLANSNIQARINGITDIIEKESIDMVQTNTSVILEGALAARIRNIPHIWHVHENLKRYSELNPVFPLPIVYWIMSYLSDKIVCVSNYGLKQFETFAEETKLEKIYNGVEVPPPLSKTAIREKLNIGKDETTAVTVGLLTESKGCFELLEAASIIKKSGNKMKFFWIGGASKKDISDFKTKVKRLKLKDSVFYLGFIDNIGAILNGFDLLICPSKNESLPLVILEAMAAKLPVISTDWEGVSESVKDGNTGFVVPLNDPIILSEKIIEVINDDKKKKIFGENGEQYFKENFTASKYSEKFENLYLDIMKKRKVKGVSEKERILTESFLQIFETASDNHWKRLKKLKH